LFAPRKRVSGSGISPLTQRRATELRPEINLKGLRIGKTLLDARVVRGPGSDSHHGLLRRRSQKVTQRAS